MGYPIAGTNLEAENIYTAVSFERAVERKEVELFRERCSPDFAANVRAKAVEEVLSSGLFHVGPEAKKKGL